MSDIKFKGFGLSTGLQWMEEHLSQEEYADVLSHLPDDVRDGVQNIDEGSWYPVSWLGAMHSAISDVKGGTPKENADLIRAMSRHTAKENLSTLMKLLLKFLTPESFVGQVDKIWVKYFKDSPPLQIQKFPGERRGIVSVEGFEGLRTLGPAVGGWLYEAYEMLGVESVEVVETSNHDSADPPTDFTWEFSWVPRKKGA